MFSNIRNKLTVAFDPEVSTAPGIHDGQVTLKSLTSRNGSEQTVPFDVVGDIDTLSESDRLNLATDIKTSIEQTLMDNNWKFSVSHIAVNQQLLEM